MGDGLILSFNDLKGLKNSTIPKAFLAASLRIPNHKSTSISFSRENEFFFFSPSSSAAGSLQLQTIELGFLAK